VTLNKCPHQCWLDQRQQPIKPIIEYTIFNHNTKTMAHTYTLDTLLQTYKSNQQLTISHAGGKEDLTNWRNIRFYHQNLKAPNGESLKQTLHKRKRSVTIYTTGMEYVKYIEKNIRNLAKYQTSWRKPLNRANIETLLDLLYKSTEIITDPQQLTRVQYRIRSEIKRKSGMNQM
jgi:hypothetical protein